MHSMYGCWGFGRRYYTKQERRELLREYKQALERELAGVAERLKELEAEAA